MNTTMELLSERGLPVSLEAENSICGAIMLDNSALDELHGIAEEVFSLDSTRRFIRAARDLRNHGSQVDIVTVADFLGKRKEIQAVGGHAWLASLTEGLPRRPSIREYVEIVRNKACLRAIIGTCMKAIDRAADAAENPLEIVTATDQELLAITAEASRQLSLQEQSDAEFEFMRRQGAGEETEAYSFGIPGLDSLVGGLVPREMTVLGARPAQGKTGLTSQVIARHCPAGVPVHAFEFEMTAGNLLRRLWAIVACVPYAKVRHPRLQNEHDTSLLRGAAREVASWPLTIHDLSSLDVAQLVSLARLGKRLRGTRIVIVDYLQRMRYPGKQEQRHLHVTEAAVQLARLAKDEDLAVLLLSSLTEKNGSSRNHAPTLQDFRQSGDIAYEAHCALLIHREIDDDTEKPRPDGEIIVAKARSDEPGCVRVHFDSATLTFQGAGKH